jgi:hypothetical protein
MHLIVAGSTSQVMSARGTESASTLSIGQESDDARQHLRTEHLRRCVYTYTSQITSCSCCFSSSRKRLRMLYLRVTENTVRNSQQISPSHVSWHASVHSDFQLRSRTEVSCTHSYSAYNRKHQSQSPRLPLRAQGSKGEPLYQVKANTYDYTHCLIKISHKLDCIL